MFPFEDERYLRAVERRGSERELSYESNVMLNIHLKILFAKDGARLFKDLGELACGESMIVIVGDPGLKTILRLLSKDPAAVDESFGDPRHLGDMSVRGGKLSAWELKTDGLLGGRGQSFW